MRALTGLANAQKNKDSQTLFTNANIFDVESGEHAEEMGVLFEGNLITKIGKGIKIADGAKVIDGGACTPMPGLIESHVHVNLQHMIRGYDTVEHRDWQEIAAMGAVTVRALLMDGWTTIRDPGDFGDLDVWRG